MDAESASKMPYSFAKANGVLLREVGTAGAVVGVSPNASPAALAELQRCFGALRIFELGEEEFDAALRQAYEEGMQQAREIAQGLGDTDLAALAENIPKAKDLLEGSDAAPVVRLINALLSQAEKEGASDIHIEPFETRSLVRFRIDGVLQDRLSSQQALHVLIVSRIKILAHLDIAEKRMPQDGHFTLRVGGRPVDVRVSTLPTRHGERVVLRLLDKQAGRLRLPELGMAPETLRLLRELVGRPHGMILATGPTGSGKTTTLYGALGELNTKELNIVTVEDPIEYDLEGIGQTQVNAKIGLTFARALRAILRQDPDVVLIGEIRDLETARSAVQASLTGHLVLATLHTNDSLGAVTRLVDLGVEPFLVASSLLGVLAQRLIRKLCPRCKKPRQASPEEQRRLRLERASLFSPAGCAACAETGYWGRTGIYELLLIDESLRFLIHERASEQRLREAARQAGMRDLREDGWRWVLSGTSSMEEIERVTQE